MTWGEFKKHVEENGVTDATEVWSIDVAAIKEVQDININVDLNDKSVSIWG